MRYLSVNLNDALKAVENWNPAVAKVLKNNLQTRSFGLVFERNIPDAVRLWSKDVEIGDKVHLLPPRGQVDTSENFKVYTVKKKKAGNVDLVSEDNNTVTVDINDVVSVVSYGDRIFPGLKKIAEVKNGKDGDPYHLLINAENYHALELLKYTYAGQVDCIYIDPPYNTGAKDWKYNNDYVDGSDAYRHSKWLAFMERRLKLARKLLKKDSVMIVTIDEKEFLRLGMLLEQIFPDARIQMISSVINPAGATRINQFSRTDEYLFIVFFGSASPVLLNLSSAWTSKKYLSDVQKLRWDGLLRGGSSREECPNLFYPLLIDGKNVKFIGAGRVFPLGVNPSPIYEGKDGFITLFPFNSNGSAGRWQLSREEFLSKLQKGFVRIRKTHKGSFSISYLKKGEQAKVESGYYKVIGYDTDGSVITSTVEEERLLRCGTQWNVSSHNATEYGTKLNNLFLVNNKFTYPKSLYAVEDCLRFFVADKPNALIVDFFAGSGTTAHATMLLNHLDGGKRKSISITNNDIGPDAEKAFTKQGLRPSDTDWQDKGIARFITWERIKSAVTGIATNGLPVKGNYKFTEEFPMSEGFTENVLFCDLTYENASQVRLGLKFDRIATLLWMKAGNKGRIIIDDTVPLGYDISENYAVLFDVSKSQEFLKALNDTGIVCAFIVTDSAELYRKVRAGLPKGVEGYQLYSNYLSNFEISAEGSSVD